MIPTNKVSELHTELSRLLKDGMTGSPVTEIGYKRNGRTRRGEQGNLFANRGGTTTLIIALVLKMTILRTGAFLLFPTKKVEVIGYALGRKNSESVN